MSEPSKQSSSVSEDSLTGWLVERNRAPVDARTRRRAVLHWIDWMACVAAGGRSPVAQILSRWQPEGTAGPGAFPSLLGMAQSAFQAVLLDAGPANVEEMDDMHRQAILHPGPVVIPALASLARQRSPAAAQVLDALVHGYEVMIRIGRAVGPRHYFYWHNTATAGAFGAAAGCASLLGLSPRQAVWALGNAGTQAAGLWQVRLEPVMSKQLHTGHAAWAGLNAATLAQAGFTGPARILEGERGFMAAMCVDGDASGITRAEDDWLIHGTSLKPWPACRHTHATIDCVLALRARSGEGPLGFQRCEVETFDDAISICDNPRPTTRTEAKFSLQYCVAAAAHFGPLRPEHFDEACYTRADLLAAAAQVTLRRAPAFTAAYPAHYGAQVTLALEDGRTLQHAERDSLGDPERSLTTQGVMDKARMLFDFGLVTPARTQAVLQAVRALLEAEEDLLARPLDSSLLRPLQA